MPVVTQMLCMFCRSSLTDKGPTHNDQERDEIMSTACRHLAHSSCISEFFPDDSKTPAYTIVCLHSGCEKTIKRDQCLLLQPIFEDRDVGPLSETETLVKDLSQKLEVANDLLLRREQIERITAMRATQAEIKLKDASENATKWENRYNLLLDDVVAQVPNYVPFTTLAAKRDESALKPLTAPPADPFPVQFEQMEKSEGISDTPQKKEPCMTIDPSKDGPNGASAVKLAPSASQSARDNCKIVCFHKEDEKVGQKSIVISNTNLQNKTSPQPSTSSNKSSLSIHNQATLSARSPVLHNDVKSNEISRISYKRNRDVACENPSSNHAIPNITSTSTLIKIRKTNSSLAHGQHVYHSSNSTDSETLPEPKRWKGPCKYCPQEGKRYRKRFGTSPAVLMPFFPLNSYPLGYTAACAVDENQESKVVMFAYKYLLLGDGYVNGVVEYLTHNRPYADHVNYSWYKSALSIEELIKELSQFRTLPPKIILSVGEYETRLQMPLMEFKNLFTKLLEALRSFNISLLYVLPLIQYPEMEIERDVMEMILSQDWSKEINGKYHYMDTLVKKAMNNQTPEIIDGVPTFHRKQFEQLVVALRERFIPKLNNQSTMPLEPTDEDAEVDTMMKEYLKKNPLLF